MTTPRANAAAIRLRDGRVLICGGTATGEIGGVLSSAELYDPVARTFTPTGSMTVPRTGQTITMLHDGRVLLTGGDQNAGYRSQLASAEIYDPSSGAFTATGSMSTPREGHTATMLRDGRVLVAGGSPNGIQTTGQRRDLRSRKAAPSAAPAICISRASRMSPPCSARAKC